METPLTTQQEKDQQKALVRMQLELSALGFDDEKLLTQLYQKLQEDKGKFHLTTQYTFYREDQAYPVDYLMAYKKNERLNTYEPYQYFAEMGKGQSKVSQAFSLKGHFLPTAKEAFNMLQGRAVNRMIPDQPGRNASTEWYQLDLKNRDEHGNFIMNTYGFKEAEFNLPLVVKTLPIKELSFGEMRNLLLEDLYQGNRVAATLERNGRHEQIYLEVSPKDRQVKLFDKKGQPLQNGRQQLVKRETHKEKPHWEKQRQRKHRRRI